LARSADRPKLTAEEKAGFRAVFRGDVAGRPPCQWCGGLHQRGETGKDGPGFTAGAACPRIRRLEWHPNSNLISVEFADKYDESGIVFPEDAFDDDED
jgi:hypothetical protein